jgi:uncharacterized YigZ family protein
LASDIYYTLENYNSNEIKIKGSRFIGFCTPVEDRCNAEAFIQQLCKKYHNATHHCFAYRIGLNEKTIFRYSDAGEPSGTAGRPIFEAIDKRSLTNIVCVVIRYYGGTKLGTGGLIRAYGRCTAETLDSGNIEKKFLTTELQIIFDYDLTGMVMPMITRYKCKILDTIYGQKTEMICWVRESLSSQFKKALSDATGGKINIIREEVAFR